MQDSIHDWLILEVMRVRPSTEPRLLGLQLMESRGDLHGIYRLNSSKRGISLIRKGTTIGVIKGDTSSLHYGSHVLTDTSIRLGGIELPANPQVSCRDLSQG